MDAEYEYVAVELATGRKDDRADERITEQLNRVASHGWRLVSIVPAAGLTRTQAVFERAKRDG